MSDIVKYYVAHFAGFAMVPKLLYDVAVRDYGAVLTDLGVIGAAFGISIKMPAASK